MAVSAFNPTPRPTKNDSLAYADSFAALTEVAQEIPISEARAEALLNAAIDASEKTGNNLLLRMASVLAGRMLHSMNKQQEALQNFEAVLRAASKPGGRVPDRFEIQGWRSIITAHANAVKLHQNGIKIAKDANFRPRDNRPKVVAK